MRDLHDLLNDSFDGHSRQVQARGAWDQGRQHSAISSIRRRRVARTAGVGGASAFAVGALALAAINLPNFRDSSPSAPGATSAWCDVDAYRPVNVDALGDADYMGRAYVDLSIEEFIFVHPDGTVEELTETSDGRYYVPGTDTVVWGAGDDEGVTRSIIDVYGDVYNGYTTGVNADDAAGMPTGHGWTTVVPEDVPPGVDTSMLSFALIHALGLQGLAIDASTIPAGATAAIVATYADGSEIEYPLYIDQPGPTLAELGATGVLTVEIQVTDLPGGDTFAIVSTFDETQVPGYGCENGPEPAPMPSDSGVDGGSVDPDEGPFAGATS
jgi:hypothetical protein